MAKLIRSLQTQFPKDRETLVGARVRFPSGLKSMVGTVTAETQQGWYEVLIAGRTHEVALEAISEVGEDVAYRTKTLKKTYGFKYVPMASLVK